MSKHSFKGGIHPPEFKDLSRHQAIEAMPSPQLATVPMVQHIGAPAKPLVKVGDEVKIGQKIAEAGGFVSAPIHAPISGKVNKVAVLEACNGQKVECIVIENDGQEEWGSSLQTHSSLTEVSREEVREIIKEAGIVGLGGAGFPTHVKVCPPEDIVIDSVILNGAECEPFLTCDHRLMLEQGEKIVLGLQALMKAVDAVRGYIAIEDNKPDAISSMKELVADIDNISINPLKTKYPQGAEKTIVYTTLGRTIPSGKLPMHVGTIVNNIHTAIAVAEAVMDGKPLVQRVVTVTGSGIMEPKNLMVRIGTPFEEVIEYCGGLKEDTRKIINGGPMTGIAQYRLDIPTEKRLTGIVALRENEVHLADENPCIRCARCVDACPASLLPNKIDRLSRLGKYDETKELGVLDCMECGACSYICPANRMLVQTIKLAKGEVRAKMHS